MLGTEIQLNATDEAVQYHRHKTVTMTGTVGSTNATLSLPISGTEVVQDNHGNWVAPLVPMYPMPDESGGMTPPTSPATNSNIRIQLKAEVPGQTNTYKLAEFRVNPTSENLDYDENGALLELPADGTNAVAKTLGWNSEGRLSSVSTNSVEIGRYFYDDHGRRIAKVENVSLTLYLWDGMDFFGVGDSAGDITEYYTRGIGIAGDVGTLVAAHEFTGSTTKLLHCNHRGNIVLATGSSGAGVHEAEFAPYGNVLTSSGSYVPRFGFSSKECDESGLIYYGYRYYSAQINQWLSPDPLGESGGLNLYRFCGNNPINYVDTDGRFLTLIIQAVVYAFATAAVITGIVLGTKFIGEKMKQTHRALSPAKRATQMLETVYNQMDNYDVCDPEYAELLELAIKLDQVRSQGIESASSELAEILQDAQWEIYGPEAMLKKFLGASSKPAGALVHGYEILEQGKE
jgi:RHS repeat-associated protein